MSFNKSIMLEMIRSQLAIDLNCNRDDFLRDGIVFCETKQNPGRRQFDRQSPFLEVTSMGKATVVSADHDILKLVQPLLKNRSREDVFAAPFLYGHTLYYAPDCQSIQKSELPQGFDFYIKEGIDIHQLYEVPGFENAIQYDIKHPRPDAIAIYAMHNDKIVAMAGASIDCSTMWQIGVDVMPAYRNKKLATSLVSKLAMMIIDKGLVPYYGAASSNIPSQAVAYRSGLIPTWMCTYKNIFDGNAPFKQSFEISY